MWSLINSTLSLVEIIVFTLESKSCKGFFCKMNFPIMRALEFITSHMVYNLAYTWILQTTTTYDYILEKRDETIQGKTLFKGRY